MGFMSRLFPWYDPEGEDMKEKRVDNAVEKGRKVEDRIQKLALANEAAALAIKQMRYQAR